MPRPLLPLALLLLSALPLAAQEPPVPDLAALRQQLASTQPAEVAWAAYRAATADRRELVPELRQVLAGIARDGVPTGREDERRHLACAVFDALIRTGAVLPAKELAPWADVQRPAVLVLAARDAAANAGLLRSFLDGKSTDQYWIAACNLLLRAAPAMLTPKLLADVEIDLTVRVSSPGCWGGRWSHTGFATGCGSGRRLEGFPPVVRYELHLGAGELFAPGPKSVGWRRVERRAATFGVGGRVPDVDRSEYALQCLYLLVGIEAADRRLQAEVQQTVDWQGIGALREAVRGFENGVRAEYATLVEELAERRLCSRESARAADLCIRLRLADDRQESDRGTPLPTVAELRKGDI